MDIALNRSGITRLIVSLLAAGLLTGCIVTNPACHDYRETEPRSGIESDPESPENRHQRDLITENCFKGDYGVIEIE